MTKKQKSNTIENNEDIKRSQSLGRDPESFICQLPLGLKKSKYFTLKQYRGKQKEKAVLVYRGELKKES